MNELHTYIKSTLCKVKREHFNVQKLNPKYVILYGHKIAK